MLINKLGSGFFRLERAVFSIKLMYKD